jgi:uncharacterized protein with NAD-binding domain and iron-sulfur cluster
MAKKRIAILGGGPGAISTAFELTNNPEWRDTFEVTIYQLGWRLGGKCASGRGEHERIEEHGLHLLGGSYENAFRMLREAYAEVGWNWEDHFQGRDNVVMEEIVKGAWEHWPYAFHDKPGTPGDGQTTLPDSIADLIERLIKWMHNHMESLEDSHPLKNVPAPVTIAEGMLAPHILRTAWNEAKNVIENFVDHEPPLHNVVGQVETFAVDGWSALVKSVEQEAVDAGRTAEEVEGLVGALAVGNEIELSGWATKLRRDYVLLMTVAAHVVGIVHNFHAITHQGFDALDDTEYKDWVRTYDPSPQKVAADGAPVNTLYELVFAYKKGQLDTPCFSAGVGVRSLVRLCFNYKGAIWYQMQGGTGDIIFGPLHQVLKQRGVKFKFFHRVNHLHYDADSGTISAVDVAEQVRLKKGIDEYNPVQELKGLWVWPNQPLYDQLDLTTDEVTELRAMQENMNGLESDWSPWRPKERPYTIQAGKDYDHLILGISLAALPTICSDLVEVKPRWRDMVTKMKTVETVCVQLWMNKTLPQLGWDTSVLGEHPFVADYAKPLSAAGDYSTLAVKEAWPPGQEPASITYFCSSWSAGENPPPSDTEFPVRTKARFKQEALNWLAQYLEHLYPNAFTNGEIDWTVFIDPEDRQGIARFDAQYWRTNLNPSDHYVLSAPGSSAYRLRAGESDVANLTLAGDWTYNGFNLGCVEASVMSGLLAARNVVQWAGMVFDIPIYGEKDFPWL